MREEEKVEEYCTLTTLRGFEPDQPILVTGPENKPAFRPSPKSKIKRTRRRKLEISLIAPRGMVWSRFMLWFS